MNVWDELKANTERLRQNTAVLKSKRLGLPQIGAMFIIKAPFVWLTSFIGSQHRQFVRDDNCVFLLVAINVSTLIKKGSQEATETVEMLLLANDGVIWTTGRRSPHDVTAPYETIAT